MWNNAIIEHTFRRTDYEGEIAELKEEIKFASEYSLTLENTIENIDVREYIADLGAELANRHEEYEAEINELNDIVYFESRKSSIDYIFQLPRSSDKRSRNAARSNVGIRTEPRKQEISIDHSEVERIDKDFEVVRARLLADEYDDVLDLEADELPGYQPIHLNGQTNLAAMGYPEINGENGAKLATVAGFLHRPEDTPDDLLMDLTDIARVIGDCDSKHAKLITVMMENHWECPADSIVPRFPGEFINVIIDEINEIALEETGDNLIFEEDRLLIIEEEYRDEIECILQYP